MNDQLKGSDAAFKMVGEIVMPVSVSMAHIIDGEQYVR